MSQRPKAHEQQIFPGTRPDRDFATSAVLEITRSKAYRMLKSAR